MSHPFKRCLVVDPHAAVPPQSRTGLDDLCDWVTGLDALAGLDTDVRAVMVVVSPERLSEGIAAAHEVHKAFPASCITVAVMTESMALRERRLRVIGIDSSVCSSPHALRRILKRSILSGGEIGGRPSTSNCELVGETPTFRHVVKELTKAAQAPSNVLITGESGTGKELAAQMIHSASSRSRQSAICMNCAAIPDALLESEMFGYQKGAFTGADHTEDGAFVRAHRGTLVLDEIGDLSLAAQAKLLRAIETKWVSRLGSHTELPADARMIALTNRCLEDMVEAGTFRRDLYFRLNVIRIEMPPLRDRLDDLPALVLHFTRHFSELFCHAVEGVTDEVLALMRQHSWPGNMRELRNVLEAAFVNQPGMWIGLDDLPRHFIRQVREKSAHSGEELAHILSALNECRWNKSHAAEKLRWSRMTLYRKMARYHLTTPEAKTLAQTA